MIKKIKQTLLTRVDLVYIIKMDYCIGAEQMLKKDERLALVVARLYYFDDLSQGQIAQQLGLSRQKVNRLLKKAKEWGLVQITLASNTQWDLEQKLQTLFALKEVQVVDARKSIPIVLWSNSFQAIFPA